MSTKSKARTATSGMGHRDRQGAGHGAAQLTFDDEEAEDDADEYDRRGDVFVEEEEEGVV